MSMKSQILVVLVAFLTIAGPARAGAWGYKSFENDDALDWVENFLKRGGQPAVERTVATVAKSTGYLEAPAACAAIAACEVLAAAQGRPSADLPPEVAALAKKLPSKVGDTVRKEARAALDKILAKSELRELWAEAKEDFEKWKKTIEDLKSRV